MLSYSIIEPMEFDKKDMLTYENIKDLLESNSPNKRASVIAKNLKYYCFIHPNGNLYKFDPVSVLYKVIHNSQVKDYLLTIITDYITQSVDTLTAEQTDYLQLKHPKQFFKISENTSVNTYITQLIVSLTDETDIFTPDFYQVHFKNGYFDLKTGEFKQRVIGEHYVCCYIARDYFPSPLESKEKLYKLLSQIYPNKEDLEAMLFILGSAITGRATKLQKILFLIGQGSAGKSTILEICKKAVTIYLETLEEDAFSESNRNKDKTFSTFHDKKAIRLVWVNEPEITKMNVSIFKKFCEGQMKGKLLYKDGVHDFNHNALPIFTSNIMPNIRIDTGVQRRFRAYEHKSLFTNDKSLLDDSKHIYWKDRDLLENLSDNDLNAFVELLCEYGCKWANGEEIPVPQSFTDTTQTIIQVNDQWTEFIENNLIITNSPDDRIYKDDMMKLYTDSTGGRHANIQLLASQLRDRSTIDYKPDYIMKVNGKSKKGCFICCKIKPDEPEEEIINNELVGDKDMELEMAKRQIQELENQLKVARAQLTLEKYSTKKKPSKNI